MKEDELMAAAQELEVCRMQLDNYTKQDELINITLEEYTRAKQALEDLKGKKKGDKILVPIGANCWVHATLGDTKKAIASVGSNIAVGQKLTEIIDRLDHQLEEIQTAQKELIEKMNKLEMRAGSLTQMLQEAYSQMEGQKGQ